MILPLLRMIFTAWHQFKKEDRKITYLWNATRFSMWVYFSTIYLLLIWTPEWINKQNVFLRNKSLFKVFEDNSHMYGRLSVAFFFAALVFIGFLIHYRWIVHKKGKKEDPLLETED